MADYSAPSGPPPNYKASDGMPQHPPQAAQAHGGAGDYYAQGPENQDRGMFGGGGAGQYQPGFNPQQQQYPQHGYPPQGYPQQGYPPQGYPPQQGGYYPPQQGGYPQQGGMMYQQQQQMPQKSGSSGAGICGGIVAACGLCCCLDMLM